MRIKAVAYVLLLSAGGCEKTDPLFCKMNPGATGCAMPDPDAAAVDGDSMMELDARVCFGVGGYEVCLPQAPMSPVVLASGNVFDTSATVTQTPPCLAVQPTSWKDAGQADACFIVGTSITIDGGFSVTGSRPLVLLAATTIAVNADIDVASHVNDKIGPGAPSPLCTNFTTVPTDSTSGAGGGAGGTFITQGGSGGTGDNTSNSAGAPINAIAAPSVLRAGCSGQDGGTGTGGQGSQGVGGAAGGAVLLLAGTSITISSGVTINASGAGSVRPPNKFAGGGGGGAGGMIVLSSPMITATGAFLMANGGGGSSGAEDTGSGNALDGEDPIPGMPTTRANGGNGSDNAGSGGDGWIEGDAAGGTGGSGQSNRAGGGGGGGGGYIRTNVASGATASPMPAVIP